MQAAGLGRRLHGIDAADTGETVNIAVLAESSALYLDQVAGSSALQPHNWVGQHIPLHATSNEIRDRIMPVNRGFAIEELLALAEAHPDSGSEFINAHVLAYANETGLRMTRSRPYHKNDNAHVEQKNFTHVREIFGYDRIEQRALIELMNEIYRELWNPLHNFCRPHV